MLETEVLYKWRSIAREMSVSERTIKRWCSEAKVYLPHWGGSRTSPVWITRRTVSVLWRVLLESNVSKKASRRLKKRIVD